jgi:hypothetical protein
VASKKEPVSLGFAVGLQIWLLFLISLYGLGYPAPFSIVLGAVGGFASGFIIDWWVTKDENPVPEKRLRDDEGVEEVARTRRRQRTNSALQHRRRRRERQPVDIKNLSRTFFGRPQKNNDDEQ